MADNQLSLFDLLEDPNQRKSVTEPRMWTLRQLCDFYYQFKRDDGCSGAFLNSIKRHLGHFTDWLKRYGVNPDREKLSDLNSAVLSDYRKMLADKTHIGIVTANLYIAHVRMLLNWAEDIYGLAHPPMGVIRKFRKNKSAKKGHGRVQDHSAIGWEELEHLFAVANVTDSALLLLGLNCGFGNTDIGTLKLSDLDLEVATVCHPRRKTGAHRRFILWPETVDILRAYLKRHRGIPANEHIAQLVFVNRLGHPMCWERMCSDGKFRRSDAIKNRFVRLYKKAGLERPYGRGYYVLRHTAATIAGLASNDLRQVQAILGHQSLPTQNFYRHDLTQKAEQAVRQIHHQLKNTAIASMVCRTCKR